LHAAQALGMPEDCLVLVYLQLRQAECWLAQHQNSSADTPEEEGEAMQRKAFALLPAAMATLQRRNAAHTLLPGGCRGYEESFDAAHLAHAALLAHQQADDDPSQFAPLLGYNTFLLAGKLAFYRAQMVSWAPSEAHMLAAHVSFVCDALDMMAQDRNFDANIWTGAESALVLLVQQALSRHDIRADREHGARVLAAWARLQRSGVLEQRGIAQGIEFSLPYKTAAVAAAAAAAAAQGLHTCALASCTAREVNAGQHKKCGACRTVGYCSKAHQVEDWPQHKAACKAARAAAAQRSDS
jgi:hypothetical protein